MKKILPLFFHDLHSTTLSPHSGHGIRGTPLGPSGYKETTDVGMNDELDEPSPIAWRVRRWPGEEHPDGQDQRPQIQRRRERRPARGGAGGLHRRVGVAAAPAWSCYGGGGGCGLKRAIETLELRRRQRAWVDLELSQQRKSTGQGSP